MTVARTWVRFSGMADGRLTCEGLVVETAEVVSFDESLVLTVGCVTD